MSEESNNTHEIAGPDRAAILLMALGEEEAAKVLKHMTPEEVQQLGGSMTKLNSISQEQIRGVLDSFMDKIGNHSALSLGTEDYLQSILVNALGKERANNVMAQILLGGSKRGLDTLKWMDPRAIAKVIHDEHPQIIAIVLSHLSSESAGRVLDLLPEETQVDVMKRIATLDEVHPAAISELDDIMRRMFEAEPEVVISGLGGIQVAAEILNSVSSSTESRVFEKLSELDDDMSEKIQEKMFVFENLLTLDDRGMQTLLRQVPNEKLPRALRGASAQLQDKIFRNMSQNAAELIKDDIEAMGPVRLSEVEEVQKEITTIAQRLADEGTIALDSKGGDFV